VRRARGAANGLSPQPAPLGRLLDEIALHDEVKVTTVLVELSAYNVMRLLHELHAERARMAFSK